MTLLGLAYENLLAARTAAYTAWQCGGSDSEQYRAALAELLKARDEFDEQKRLDKGR